jgi:hypothetical protein
MFLFGIGPNGGNGPILFLFLFPLALSCEAGFRRPRAKREKKKSAGAEKKERPPERATFLYQILKSRVQPRSGNCFYARGEEDTERENKTGRTLARPPIGGPSECRGGSANLTLGWVGKQSN